MGVKVILVYASILLASWSALSWFITAKAIVHSHDRDASGHLHHDGVDVLATLAQQAL